MVRDEEIYKQALIFRKRGFTYVEIAKICGVSKSTVANWCKGKRFSKQVAKDNAARAAAENAKRVALLQKARQAERKNRYQEAKMTAETSYRHYATNSLFIAGVMLYAAHGDRSESGQIRFTSTNPDLHRIFRSFMTEFLGLKSDAIPFWLLLYASHDESVCQKRWAKALSLPKKHFGKTQILPQTTKALHFGTGNTIIGNTVSKRMLLTWVNLALKEL